MTKKKKENQKYFFAEGNKGGDYVRLFQTPEQEKNDTIELEIGHCCTIPFHAVVPVEFLTTLITHFMFNADGNKDLVENMRELFADWSKDFKEQLLAKVKEL